MQQLRFQLTFGRWDQHADFWRRSQSHGWYGRHPIAKLFRDGHADVQRTMALRGFGDDTGVRRTMNMGIMHWSSDVRVHAPSLLSKIPFYMFPLHFDVDGEAEFDLHRAFTWSMDCLLHGQHPLLDHLGQKFPPGSRMDKLAGSKMPFRGVCVGTLCDWKWAKEAFSLPWYYRTDEVCHLCRRHVSEIGVVGELAPLRGDDEYWAQANAPLAHLEGWSLQHVWSDPMHAGALGICQELCGSILIDIINEGQIFGHIRARGSFKDILQEKLDVAFDSFVKYCKVNHLQHAQPRFTVASLNVSTKTKSWPRLKAKAHNTLQVQHWLSALLQAHDDWRSTDLAHLRCATVWGFHTMFFVCRQAADPNWLSAAERLSFLSAADIALHGYNALSAAAFLLRHVPRYALKPKLHMLVHLRMDVAESSRNVCARWCFQDEDNLQYLKKIGQSMHPVKVGHALEKWALNFYLHFDQL